jgi:ADP-ribosylglycohydrolase
MTTLTDTTAAICGQIVGAFYGGNVVSPEHLVMVDKIHDIADRLYQINPA